MPLSTNFVRGEGFELKHSIEIESLGEFANIGDFYVSLVDSGNRSDFQYVFVPSSNISLFVASSRTYAEGPGTFYSSVIFLAVVYALVQTFDDLKVTVRTHLLHGS